MVWDDELNPEVQRCAAAGLQANERGGPSSSPGGNHEAHPSSSPLIGLFHSLWGVGDGAVRRYLAPHLFSDPGQRRMPDWCMATCSAPHTVTTTREDGWKLPSQTALSLSEGSPSRRASSLIFFLPSFTLFPLAGRHQLDGLATGLLGGWNPDAIATPPQPSTSRLWLWAWLLGRGTSRLPWACLGPCGAQV